MITGIIMASGYSKRMGQNKLLMDFRGKPIIEYVIEAARDSDLDKIIIIYRDERIAQIGKTYEIECFYNDRAHLGQSQSVILGVKEAPPGSYMFFVGDQPFINPSLINKLIKKHKEDEKKIIIPKYKDKMGMPIIFPNKFKEDLLKVDGDKGGRDIIRENPDQVNSLDIGDEKLLVDIDNIKEYKYWDSSHL